MLNAKRSLCKVKLFYTCIAQGWHTSIIAFEQLAPATTKSQPMDCSCFEFMKSDHLQVVLSMLTSWKQLSHTTLQCLGEMLHKQVVAALPLLCGSHDHLVFLACVCCITSCRQPQNGSIAMIPCMVAFVPLSLCPGSHVLIAVLDQ